MHKEPSLVVAMGLVGVTAISGVALTAPMGFATENNAEAQASVVVSATCSMTATVDTAHTATLINGQYSGDNGSYSSGIGQTTISTMCNDPSGYAIYAIGYTSNTDGNNVLANSAISGYDIASGTATSGNTSNWAMKVSPVTNGGSFVPIITDDFKDGSGDPAFSTVPSSQYTKVAYLNGNTGEASQASSITTTYAAYISPSQPAGTYTGQVAYLLVHPANLVVGTYSIAYYATGGSGAMDTETAKNYEPHTLATNTFTAPAGYTFKGWCTVQDTNATPSSPQTTCDGTSYNPDAIIPVSTISAGNTLNLYAVWEIPVVVFKVGDNIDTIIVFRNDDRSNKPYYASSTNDIRFEGPTAGTTYTVTVVPKPNYKLDNWTTTKPTTGLTSQTLLTTTYTVTGSETLIANGTSGSYTAMKDFTNTNCTVATNVTDERDGKSYTVAPIGGYCYMLSNLRLDNTNPNGTQRELESTYSDITPNGTYSTFNMPQNYYCKAIMKHYDQVNTSNNEYRNEYYYNWYAARANPYVCTNPTSSTNATLANDNNNSLGSICPKNWTLPAYNSSTNDIPYSSFNASGNPGFLATSGYFYSGAQYSVGSLGYWWSSTRGDNISAYGLYLSSGSAIRGLSVKYYGLSVRCMRSS